MIKIVMCKCMCAIGDDIDINLKKILLKLTQNVVICVTIPIEMFTSHVGHSPKCHELVGGGGGGGGGGCNCSLTSLFYDGFLPFLATSLHPNLAF